jgi:hypothetical protein
LKRQRFSAQAQAMDRKILPPMADHADPNYQISITNVRHSGARAAKLRSEPGISIW